MKYDHILNELLSYFIIDIKVKVGVIFITLVMNFNTIIYHPNHGTQYPYHITNQILFITIQFIRIFISHAIILLITVLNFPILILFSFKYHLFLTVFILCFLHAKKIHLTTQIT
jgi:hypothetical protein